MSAPWRVLVLVYRHTDCVVPLGGSSVHVRRSMSSDEYETNRRWIERMRVSVREWSEGNASLDPFDVVDVERPIRHLTPTGEALWVAPDDCRAEIAAHAPRGRYDNVIVAWTQDDGLPLCGWGCSIGPTDEAGGAGFSSCATSFWRHFVSNPHPQEGYVHEWLHQVEATFRGLGAGPTVFPDLHAAGDLRSARDPAGPPHGLTYGEYEARTTTWQPWYRDYMTGTIARPDGAGSFGIGAPTWSLRAPLDREELDP